MALLKSSTAATVNSTLNTTSTGKKSKVFTLPLETFTIDYGESVKGDQPKVILSLAEPVKGIGTIQIFAPKFRVIDNKLTKLSYDDQLQYLAEHFEPGKTITGAEFQEGLYFKRYEVDGPNYEIIETQNAIDAMKTTNTNSSVMEFGAANTKMSRKDVETATSLSRGNYGKVAVQSGGVMDILKGIFS